MAITQGHGNPAWTEDEIILALDLYFELDAKVPDASHPQVIALSGLLRSMPYHAEAARKATFRNPAGVAFKLQNLRNVATGKGLSNTARADKAVWEAWGSNPAATRDRAKLIRASLHATGVHEHLGPLHDEEVFAEGRTATYFHRRRERSPKLRRALLQKRRASNSLQCDICGFRNQTGDIRLDEAGLEAHHVRPLAELGQTTTKVSDLALLCATCHRLVHRVIATQKRWLSVGELRATLQPMY